MTNFRLCMPSDKRRGHPIDYNMLENFKKLCAWLEKDTDNELYTSQELHLKMGKLSENTPCYSLKSLKRKLVEYYGDHIFLLNSQADQILLASRIWHRFCLTN